MATVEEIVTQHVAKHMEPDLSEHVTHRVTDDEDKHAAHGASEHVADDEDKHVAHDANEHVLHDAVEAGTQTDDDCQWQGLLDLHVAALHDMLPDIASNQ